MGNITFQLFLYFSPFIVELEKELELEKKQLEKKDDGKQCPRESPLKSNAMLTKTKKKKPTSSKRKSAIQNKNKELGRVISLNIIYEEPAQKPGPSGKESIDENKNREAAPEIEHSNEIELNNAQITGREENGSITTKGENEPSNDIALEQNCATKQEPVPKESINPELAVEINRVENRGATTKAHVAQITDCQDLKDTLNHFPPPDDNWELRLPPMDLSTNLKPEEEARPPAASGVYYNEAPTEEKHFIQTESTNSSHQQPPDISSIAPAGCVPMVQVFETEPYTEAHWYPLDIVCRTFREQGNNIIYL